MRRGGLIFLVLCAAFLFTGAGQAQDTDAQTLVDTQSVLDALPDSARDTLDSGLEQDAPAVFGRILDTAGAAFGGIFSSAVQGAAALVLIALFCGVGASACAGEGGGAERCVELAGVLAAAGVSAGQVNTFVGLAAQTMDALNAFSKALLPTLTACCAFTGSTTAGAAKYAAAMLCSDVLLTAANGIVFPLIFAYVAASAAAAAFGGSALNGTAKLVKWVCVAVLTGIVTVFVTYITVSGAVAGTADAAATRLAKTAISSAVPVAGGMISDAAAAVTGGLSALQGTVGVFGLLAVTAACALPFLRLGIHYLVFKAAALLAACAAGERVGGLIDAVAGAFGLALGTVGAGAIMLFVSIVSMMKVVSG